MSVQLSVGSLKAILSGKNLKFPKLQVMQLGKIKFGNGEMERHQLSLSDGINFFGLVVLGTHLNTHVETGDVQKFSVIKINKYSLESNPRSQMQRMLCVFDLDVIRRGNQICRIIGTPTRLVCSSELGKRNEENFSGKQTTVVFESDGPSNVVWSTSSQGQQCSDMMLSPSQGTLDENTHILETSTRLMIGPSSPDSILSFSEGDILRNDNLSEVSTVDIFSCITESTPQIREENFFPIISLTPYSTRWTIKAWVSRKSSVNHWKNKRGKSFSVDLIDRSGEIWAAAFNECCDLFCNLLEENNSYIISDCKVVSSNRKLTSIKNEYQLVFTEKTKVTPGRDNASNMPSPCYNFQPISSICNLPCDECIDVLGVCESILDIEYVQSKSSSNEIRKQEVTLVDKTNTEVTLTLWELDAGKLNDSVHQVVAMKGAKISELMGKRNLYLTFSSSLKVNPDIPLAHELRHWFDSIGCIQLSTSISSSILNGGEDASSLKTLMDVEMCDSRELTGEVFQCSAFILIIKKTDVLYKACPSPGCNKKVSDFEDFFWCDSCKKELRSFEWRILLKVKIGDFTNQVWVTCFHEVAERLLNTSADELAKMRESQNKENYEQVFENVTFRYFKFMLRTRLNNYKGEEKFQIVASRVRKLNYIEHNRKLIQVLNSERMS